MQHAQNCRGIVGQMPTNAFWTDFVKYENKCFFVFVCFNEDTMIDR